MSANNESFAKTIGVVVGVCLVCALFVAGSAVGLRPEQKANELLDKQINILDAAGLLEQAGKDVPGYFGKNIEERFVDLNTGEYVEQAAGYDQYKAARDPELSVKPQEDVAKILRRPNVASVYLAKDTSGKVETIVLPINGSGLWDVMYGFVALNADGVTTKNVVYYKHKETPGLGGEVQNPKWKALWDGKKLFDEQGNVAIKIVKGGAKQGDLYGVDGLSGATLTSNGVQHTFTFWFGKEGFGPYLAKVRANGA